MRKDDAGAMVAMLKKHYLPDAKFPPGHCAVEIESPDGRRRADLLFVPTTSGVSAGIIGHEIKVSRADVLVELNDPAKADPWAQYCERWYLVVSDIDFLAGLNVPPLWGIMAPPSGRLKRSMTIVRPAPRLTPLDATPALRRILKHILAANWNRDEAHARTIAEYRRKLTRLETVIRDRTAVAITGRKLPEETLHIASLVERAKSVINHDVGFWAGTIDDEAIIAALVDHGAARIAAKRIRDDIEALLHQLDREQDSFQAARSDFARSVKASLGDWNG